MRIAIIGAGNVGGTLARRWADLGHDIVLGLRDPHSDKARALGLPAATPPEAAASAEALLLATPGDAAIAAAQSCGDLSGKILIDATNPLSADLETCIHPNGLSGAQLLAEACPAAHVVKAFNTIGYGIMAQPVRDGRPSVLLLSGDHRPSVDRVSALATETGFDPIYLGGLAAARIQEEHAVLWIHLAIRSGLGPDFVFAVHRGPAS